MTTDLLTVFIISMGGALFGQMVPSRGRNLWGKRRGNLLGLLISCTVVVLYAGLRSNIGDTFYYLHIYNLTEEAGAVMPVWGTKAYLFELFQYWLHNIGADKGAFVMITTIISTVPMFWVFYKYAYSFETAIFFFFTTGLYVASMNGIRQFFATGIILLGTKYLFSPKKTDFFKFLILILIASLIHSSAVFMIPVYFLCRQKAWSAPTFAVIGASVIGLIFVSQFMPSFLGMLEDTNYSSYATDGWFTQGVEKGTSIFRVAFNCIPMVLSIIFSKQLKRNGPIADILINLSVLHSAIFILALYNWIFARFAIYTYAFTIMLLSLIVVSCLREGKNKGILIILIIAYMIFFFKDSHSNMMNLYSTEFFTPNNNVWLSFL